MIIGETHYIKTSTGKVGGVTAGCAKQIAGFGVVAGFFRFTAIHQYAFQIAEYYICTLQFSSDASQKGSAVVIGADFFSRQNMYGLYWLALEAALVLLAYQVCHHAITELRSWTLRGADGEGAGQPIAGYGAAAGASA